MASRWLGRWALRRAPQEVLTTVLAFGQVADTPLGGGSLSRFRRNVRPVARAPRSTERRAPRRNRATSSRQPAGVSPVRGDARVPGSSTPGVGREPGVEAEEDRPLEGAGDWPVRSMKRSLQRRQESPRKRTKREPSLYSDGEGHGRHLGAWSGCQGTLRRRGRGTVGRLSWELERPSVAPSLRGSGSSACL